MNNIGNYNLKYYSHAVARALQVGSVGLIITILIFQAIILFSIPLSFEQNDSAWYWMNVHYLLTDIYVYETFYPSFTEPSQLFTLLGYSGILWIAKQVQLFTGIDWALLIKVFQFSLYIACVYFVYKISTYVGLNKLGLVCTLFFLAYHPNFNFTNFIMSETYAMFLLLAITMLFLKYLQTSSFIYLSVYFLIHGYSILVKPIFILLAVFTVPAFLFMELRREKYNIKYVLVALLFFLFPVTQSVLNKQIYGNYSIRTGLGWNLWNRVVYQDGMIPLHSETFNEIELKFNRLGLEIPEGPFWKITSSLSHMGYKKSYTQKVCFQISLDAIMERPFKYMAYTFINGYKTFKQPPEDRLLVNSVSEYYELFDSFGLQRQHVPLANELKKQKSYIKSPYADSILYANKLYASFSATISKQLVHFKVNSMMIMFGFLYFFIQTFRKKDNISEIKNAFLFFIPLAIIIGSNLAERAISRFMLPTIPLIIILLTMMAYHLAYKLIYTSLCTTSTKMTEND